jgi:hypothetical protein
MFDLIPNYLHRDEESVGCNVHEKLAENDLGCLVLNNTGKLLQFYFVYISAKLLVLILNIIWRCLRRIIKKVSLSADQEKADFNECMGLEFFYNMCQAI